MWKFYEKSTPIRVKDGIKAQTKRGEFAQRWWGKRWISALETFHDSARLGRGRTYARKGQVLSIEIKKGIVQATVQGSRSKPYYVTIEVDALSPASWRQVIEILSTQAVYAAKLMAGEMPNDIEKIFEESKISLLPKAHNELETDCSCPDWSNPCKHVAAVYYLLAEEFDRDPFLIFKLRGMDREEFLDLLENHADVLMASPEKNETARKEPLQGDLQGFWAGEPLPEDFHVGDLHRPEKPAILPRSLGKFPFWRGQEDLHDTLEKIYTDASERVQNLLLDETD